MKNINKNMKNKVQYFMIWFTNWFASLKGTIQTTIVVLAWVIVEQTFPNIDPNGFILLYILTVWSAITQNLLAYTSTLSAIEAQKSQDLLMQLLSNNVHQLEFLIQLVENQNTTISKLDNILQKLSKHVEELNEDVIEIQQEIKN